jgi:hypothetical protein
MEQWKKWEPINGIPTRIYKYSLIDNENGIVITFDNETNDTKLIITFDSILLSYRNTDEGALIETWKYLDENNGTNFYSQWPLFKIENSKYLKWFLSESSGIYQSRTVEHYAFLTPNDVIEVLSTSAPTINIIEA